ncbi:uncharacterized protein LOC103722540 isoform X3 [Phoenix dactylifera]|uniref:Uncharacterized protein LOC103722540 isoform X3 n=1 Tax=Phoenix dactylifera TaxID=42345 RepID=A0A8B7D1L4_PHODC|nr:uncharacterized protein LOC103722540 isoform X3 [Phoenix dactylifera]
MAKNMEDAEFWLPSEFLCDDFFLEGDETTEPEAEVAGASFSSQLFSGSDSNPSSTVESLTGTESEEESYMACRTQKMARSFFQDDEGSPLLPGDKVKMTRDVMAGSPQCTLSPWSASGKGNPSGPSMVSSPPSTPLEQYKDDAWDLLYDPAWQVRRLRLNDPSNKQHDLQGRGLLRKPPAPISAASDNHSTGYHDTLLTQQQLQAAQFRHLRQQQLVKERESRARGGSCVGGYGEEKRYGRPLGLPPSAWPPLQKPQRQPRPGSGMRAVFLTGAGVRKESTGTGVFLPRRVGAPTESSEKPACWTVLLPARVVQALNLNPEESGARQGYPAGFVLDHDVLLDRANTAFSQQKRSHFRPQHPVVASDDIRLPPEWTY